jgi:hypothetical protein
VLFVDGSGIVGEIALHENSVDKVCTQIGNYAVLDRIPGPGGRLTAVEHVDVILLVHADVGLAALKRIIRERFADPEHPYSPPEPPCIAQFFRTESHYTFQRLPHPDNGALCSGGRTPDIGAYMDEGLRIQASRFVATKARRGFINDPINPLYLATHLWTRTWPTEFGGGQNDITVEEQATAELLKRQYGVGGVTVVRQALDLLKQAGLALSQGGGTWTVSRRLLGRSGDRDVHKHIARKATTQSSPRVVGHRAAPRPQPPQDTLF